MSTLNFTLTEKDWENFQKENLNFVQQTKQEPKKIALWFTAIFLAPMIPFLYTTLSWEIKLAVFTGPLLFIFLLAASSNRRRKRRAKRWKLAYLLQQEPGSILGNYNIMVSPVRLKVDKFASSEWLWNKRFEYFQTPNYLYIYPRSYAVLIVPKKKIKDKNALKQVIGFLKLKAKKRKIRTDEGLASKSKKEKADPVTSLLKKYGYIRIFSEVSLFLMLISFLLVFISHFSSFSEHIFAFFSAPDQQKIIDLFFQVLIYGTSSLWIMGALIVISQTLDFKRGPDSFSKYGMVFFGVIIQIMVAYLLFRYHQTSPSFWSHFLAYFHVLEAFLVYLLIKEGMVSEDQITDQNAKPYEIIVGLALILFLFWLMSYSFKWPFEIVFSVLINYSLFFNRFLSRSLFKILLSKK